MKTNRASDYQVGGSHYKDLGVEPWEVMEQLDRDHFIGFLRFNVMKYMMRLESKDEPATNAAKAAHYASKLAEVLKNE